MNQRAASSPSSAASPAGPPAGAFPSPSPPTGTEADAPDQQPPNNRRLQRSGSATAEAAQESGPAAPAEARWRRLAAAVSRGGYRWGSADDRVLQWALALLLETTAEWRFSGASHGYRPGRSAATALAYAQRRVTADC